MKDDSSLQLSQGYEVLAPKSGKAYPIPCEEWDLLKTRIKRISNPPFLFVTVGSLLLGAALSTFITIILGSFSAPDKSKELITAWAAVGVTTISGILSLIYAYQQQKDQRVQANEVVAQMEVIEKRYEQQ